MFLGGYTGVLLATTSIPLWSRSKLLGAVFISSAMSTGSALISLLLRLAGGPDGAVHKLERLEWAALLVEMSGLLAFLRGSGRAARPLVGVGPAEQGPTFWRFVFGGGLVLPWLLQSLSLLSRRPGGRPPRGGILISLLVLLGGYTLRHTIVVAGRTSSQNARATLWHSRERGG
jgi:formate-dependent nitrite reductase membrane component NrfD